MAMRFRAVWSTLLSCVLAVLLALLLVPVLASAQGERITIRGSSRGGKYPLGDRWYLEATLDHEPVLLKCEPTESSCVFLQPGEYEVARLVPHEGLYKDCTSIDIYRMGADRLKEKPLGEYCVLYPQG